MNRQFKASRPNQLWVCDFTYVATWSGFAYTAFVTDVHVSVAYTERLAEIHALPSIGSIGDSYDNALAESVNGLYKTELIRRQGPWRLQATEEWSYVEREVDIRLTR